MRRHALLGCLTSVLFACSKEAPRDPAKEPQSPASRPGTATQTVTLPSDPPYTGPECTAELVDEGKGKVAKISVQVPTLGYQLVLDQIVDRGRDDRARDSHVIRVLLTLTAPGKDEMTGQMLETLVERASVPPGCSEVLVLISRERRKEQYFRKPDYELAKRLMVPR